MLGNIYIYKSRLLKYIQMKVVKSSINCNWNLSSCCWFFCQFSVVFFLKKFNLIWLLCKSFDNTNIGDELCKLEIKHEVHHQFTVCLFFPLSLLRGQRFILCIRKTSFLPPSLWEGCSPRVPGRRREGGKWSTLENSLSYDGTLLHIFNLSPKHRI